MKTLISATFSIVALVIIWQGIWFSSNDMSNITQMQIDASNLGITIDKVYVISLDRTPERYLKIKTQLDLHKIKHVRFRAIDGYELEISDQDGNIFLGKDLKSGKHCFEYGKVYTVFCGMYNIVYRPKMRHLTAGELGCYCSHYTIFHDMLNNNLNHILVLEDDAELHDDFDLYFSDILQNTPKNMDILYMFLLGSDVDTFTAIKNNQYVEKIYTGKGLYSMAAYILSKKGAKKLIGTTTPAQIMLDDQISTLINKNDNIDAYHSTHEVISAKTEFHSEDSILHQMGRAF